MLVLRGGLAALVLLSSLAGCLTNVDTFAKRAAKFDCINLEACEGSVFDDNFSSQSDCRDELTNEYEDTFRELDELCDYDPKEARKCIRTARKNKKECSASAFNDLAADCDEVFDCGIAPELSELDPDAPRSVVTDADSLPGATEYPASRPVFETAFR